MFLRPPRRTLALFCLFQALYALTSSGNAFRVPDEFETLYPGLVAHFFPSTREPIMTTLTPEMSGLKTRLKATWESGDYGVFAKYLEKGALEFFNRLDIKPGTRLLDIACGAGQLTHPAARKGIQVTGLDLAANLVQQARDRAAAEGLAVDVDEGDAENLPYADASFDVVIFSWTL